MLKTFFPFGLSVSWQHAAQLQCKNEELSTWLLDTGSLTERLEAISTQFSVELLGQGKLPLDRSEKLLLNSEDTEQWQIREVILYGDGVPWVFARSVLPVELCSTSLANLGNKPLGKRIFNDPSFLRSEFEVGELKTHPLTQRSSNDQTLYARRSLFTFDGSSVLVAEAFLPDCPCYKTRFD